MKKRLLANLILMLLCCVVSFAFGCNETGHKHDFSLQVLSEEYKASDATYKEKAKYYYSCECGAKGSQIFEYGEIVQCENHVEEWIVDKNPTCYDEGAKHSVCQICKIPLNSAQIDKLTHNYINNKCEYCSNVAVSNGLDFVKTQDGLGCVLTGIGSAQAINVKVPEYYSGLPVVEVKADAFTNLISLKTLILPNTIKKIGFKALYGCTSLEELVLPFVGESFDEHNNTHIGYMFGANSFEYNSYYLPNSLKKITVTYASYIGENAFRNCSKLQTIILTDNTYYICDNAFYNCSELTSIIIGDSIESIGDSAFSGCSSLRYNTKGFLKYLGNDSNPYLCLVSTENKTLKTAEIDDGCKYICSLAFANTQISKIEIPLNVRIVAPSAFHNCNQLEEITIPFIGQRADGTGVTDFGIIFGQSSVGNKNEYVPSSLKKVIVSNAETINNGAFANCSKIEYIQISETVKNVQSSAFASCSSLKEFFVPNSVVELGNSVFSNCSSLQFVSLSNQITHLPSRVFSGCSSLAEVNLNENLLSMGEYAFSNCTALWSVDIPNNVKEINQTVFNGCSNLVEITFGDSVEKVSPLAFDGCNMLKIIDVTPANPNLTSIGGSLYSYDKEKLLVYAIGKEDVSFTLPNTVKIIGEYAFCGSKLNNVIITNNVEFISNYVFYNCNNLRTIKFLDTSTWYYTTSQEQWLKKRGGIQIDLSNLTDNVSYFNNNLLYYWYKI